MSGYTSKPAISFNYAVEIEIASPDVVQILLNGSPSGIQVEIPPDNAGVFLADVTVVTHSGNPYDKALILGGPDGNKFVFTNEGIPDCDLHVGTADLDAGGYNIKITAP